MQSVIKREGDSYLLNGVKWWTSGAMDPRCAVAIFMGKTDPSAPAHLQQSMVGAMKEHNGRFGDTSVSLYVCRQVPLLSKQLGKPLYTCSRSPSMLWHVHVRT
jgi:hypothetical protein